MKKIEAINHARKYLVPNSEPDSKQIERAAGMLVFAQDTRAEPYKVDILCSGTLNPSAPFAAFG